MYNGTGSSITMATGFFAEVLSFDAPEQSRVAIDTSHLATVRGKTYIPGDLIEGGELKVEMAFDPSTEPPIDDAAETVTLSFSDGTQWSFTGFMTAAGPRVPLEDRMTQSVTVKVSGDITVTSS